MCPNGLEAVWLLPLIHMYIHACQLISTPHLQDDPTQKSRNEDAIIAYTWYHYIMNTSDPEYLLRLPMTKVWNGICTVEPPIVV